MVDLVANPAPTPRVALQRYYFLRAGVGAAWVVAAFTLGMRDPFAAGLLLIAYPAWDALANALDARANGGFKANPSQALNTVVSAAVTVAVAIALRIDLHLVLGVLGAWAILAGLLQLATGVRRWRTLGAQWAMILSGAQSALAGGFFIFQAVGPAPAQIMPIAGYAAFGAFYFLVSAIALSFKGRKRG